MALPKTADLKRIISKKLNQIEKLIDMDLAKNSEFKMNNPKEAESNKKN